MTWEEWVDSEYNIINASIYTLSSGVDYITLGRMQGAPIIICDSNDDYVITTQEIIANHNYSSTSGGGSA